MLTQETGTLVPDEVTLEGEGTTVTELPELKDEKDEKDEVEIMNEIIKEEDGVIPPIFVMNLKRSHDRWAMAQLQMKGEGLTVERFDAVDGRALSNEELRKTSTRMAMFLQPRGVIGCYLSHRKFWQMVVDEGYESAIIFEDDVKLVPHFKERLKEHLDLFGDEKYDVVLLGKCKMMQNITRFTLNLFVWKIIIIGVVIITSVSFL